jgi:hypothetical protein
MSAPEVPVSQSNPLDPLAFFFLRTLSTRTLLSLSGARGPVLIGWTRRDGAFGDGPFNWLRIDSIARRWATVAPGRAAGLWSLGFIAARAEQPDFDELKALLDRDVVRWTLAPGTTSQARPISDLILEAALGVPEIDAGSVSIPAPFHHVFLTNLVARNRGASQTAVLREAVWLFNHEYTGDKNHAEHG